MRDSPTVSMHRSALAPANPVTWEAFKSPTPLAFGKMSYMEEIMDMELRCPEDEALNVYEINHEPISKPVGVRDLRQWGQFVLEDGKLKGKNFPGSLRERSRLREVYRQSKAQADVEKPRVLPRLCTGNGDDEAPEDNNMEDESDAVEHDVGHTRRRDGHSGGAWPRRTTSGTSDAMFANAHDQQQQLDGEEEPKGKRSPVMGDDCSDAQRGDRPVGSGAGTGTENSDRDPVKGAESSRGQEGLIESPSEQIVPLSQNQMQAIFAALEQTAGEIERSFCTEFLELDSKAGIDRDMRTFLQVDVGVEDSVGDAVVSCGGYRWKVHISRRDLRQSNYEHRLRKSIEKSRPRHIWMNVGLKDMTPSERQRVSELVQDLYDVQVLRGDHFHVWTATDMQPKEAESHQEAWLGTIPTVYTEHPKGWAPRLKGNNFLHSRRQFRTTSKVAHSWLDVWPKMWQSMSRTDKQIGP